MKRHRRLRRSKPLSWGWAESLGIRISWEPEVPGLRFSHYRDWLNSSLLRPLWCQRVMVLG